uniref:Uncharacterized protein At2g38980 n=1 Tax=Arabidopsis thaliana TaxID=3702 RepID=Q8W4F8_ARATH|nr:Unknown protein [Arabidopsis thaliana]AAN72107.1 Unknown protein [Arabidopsis thaliana]
MSHPSSSIHEMSFSYELLFVKRYCQPFGLGNICRKKSWCFVYEFEHLKLFKGYTLTRMKKGTKFGHKGGFLCSFVPYLPVLCILINTYLIINIGAGTWIRVLVSLLIGSMICLFCGRSHCLLNNVVYVPTTTCTRKTTDHLA